MAKEKSVRLPVSRVKKTVLCILAVAMIAALSYLIYYLVHYQFYSGYKKYLTAGTYEEGRAYAPMADPGKDVAGMDLVAESDVLKLYTDTKSGYVALFDKRNGKTVYSNPLNADEDSVANKVNVDYLKSQMIVQYYNSDIITGTFDSYSAGVSKGNLKVESIDRGVRYIYTLGENKDDSIRFEIPLEYRLIDDHLEVSVPAAQIKEFNGSVYRIQLLRYFGAASKEETGYTVVPNGAGSLIEFNNGKTGEAAYAQYIYGLDPLVSDYSTTENTLNVKLPLYALCREDSSVLATVEEGAPVALISADISGKYNDYNYAYTTFVLRNADNLRMFGNNTQDVFVLEKKPYDINCTVRYTLLTEENKGYNGVAAYYRRRLISEGNLSRTEKEGDIPFYCDIITGVRETAHFLGVQYLNSFAMTSFDEAAEISEELSALGLNNQVVNLQGWFNSGYYHKAAHDIRIVSEVGNRAGLSKLNNLIREKGGRLYVDTAFQRVTFADNGFNYKAESSRYYSGYVVSFGSVDPTTLRNTAALGYQELRYDVLSPAYLPRYVAQFASKIKKYDVDGISLRDLGSDLASDKRRTRIIDREQALDIVKGQFTELENTGKNLMTAASNAYAFKYSTDIINAPVYSNDYRITDYDIPLYAMIIHGHISYSSELLNYVDDEDLTPTILMLIENGASPHYVFTKEESSRMKNTAMNSYYCTTFDNWKDEAAYVYKSVNDILKHVTGAEIVSHEILSAGLRKITYSNGKVIYLNPTEFDLKDGLTTVPAMSARLEGDR